MRREPILKPADMTNDQHECWRLICDVVGGDHHFNGTVHGWGVGIKCQVRWVAFATTDPCYLTTLVLLAHDRCIRVEIGSGAPGHVAIELFKRKQRQGAMHERHSTIEDAIALHRRSYPKIGAIDAPGA